jgi:hypothetical protein
MADIVVERYSFRPEAPPHSELEIDRLKPYSPGDHDLSGSYCEVYAGNDRTNSIFTAMNWADLVAYLKENYGRVGDDVGKLIRLVWSDPANKP